MINIDKFRTFINTISNKDGRGTITPEQFNSLTERGLYSWVNKQVSNQMEYKPGLPIPNTSLDLDSISQERLRHLRVNHTIKVTDGVANLPNGINVDMDGVIMPDMWIPSRLSHKYAKNGVLVEKDIKVVKDMEWGLIVNSNIMSPTKKRAIASMQSNYMNIEPKSLLNLVTLSYIKNPSKPEWKYTLVSNRPIYDSANSVDIDAPESAFNAIAMLVLEFIGVKIRDSELFSAASGFSGKGI